MQRNKPQYRHKPPKGAAYNNQKKTNLLYKNALVAIVGNSWVLPVAAGLRLDNYTLPADCETLFESPIINIQNAPAAPDPTGINAMSNLLGTQGLFKDMTGLEGTQKIALDGMLDNQKAAQNYASMAASIVGNAQKALEGIDGMEKKGQISPEKAATARSKITDGLSAMDWEKGLSDPIADANGRPEDYGLGKKTGNVVDDIAALGAAGVKSYKHDGMEVEFGGEINESANAGDTLEVAYTTIITDEKALTALAKSKTLQRYMAGFQEGGKYHKLGFDIIFKKLDKSVTNVTDGNGNIIPMITLGETSVRFKTEGVNWLPITDYSGQDLTNGRILFEIKCCSEVNTHEIVYTIIHELGVHIIPFLSQLENNKNNIQAMTAFKNYYVAELAKEDNQPFQTNNHHIDYKNELCSDYETMKSEILNGLIKGSIDDNRYLVVERSEEHNSIINEQFWIAFPGAGTNTNSGKYGYLLPTEVSKIWVDAASNEAKKYYYHALGSYMGQSAQVFHRHRFLHELIDQLDFTMKAQYPN